MFTLNRNYKWINALSQFISDYISLYQFISDITRASIERSIYVNVIPTIAEKLLAMVYSNVKIADSAKFKIGDSAREQI